MKRTALIAVLLLIIVTQPAFAEQGSDAGAPPTTMERKTMEYNTTSMEKRGDLKDAIQEKRAGMIAEMKEKKVAFKEKLQTIKDERKKATAERLDTRFDAINQMRTNRMTENLKKLSDILSRLEAKKIEAQTNGKDISTVNAAIVVAEQAIANAEAAVSTQAAKDYTAQITGEATLKQNFSTVLMQLKTDLKATNQTVVNAKDAVKNAAKALSLIEGEIGATVTPGVTSAPTI